MARIKENVPYIFIHPAWRGAWCWDKVLDVMHAWGRDAYAVDCPGHGERFNEIEDARLIDYPQAIVDFIEQKKLDRVVLVGNSTGGLICQLTAQAVPEKISHVVWYMAFINENGQSILDACPPEYSKVLPELKNNRYPLPPREVIRARWMNGMTAEQQTADLERWQEQPLHSFTDKPDLDHFYNDSRVQKIPKSFINGVKDMCFDWDYRKSWDPRLSGRIGKMGKDFTYAEIPSGHCGFNDSPEELSLAVIELAEYEYRTEAYAREELWRKSPSYLRGKR